MNEPQTTPLETHSVSESVETVELDVLDGPCAGRSLRSSDGEVTVGTAINNALVLEDPSVSRYHLGVRATAAGLEIADRGSTNGTFVGNVRLERGCVPSGTIVRVGRTRLRVASGAGASVELHPGTELGALYGSTTEMRRLMHDVSRAAHSSAAVLICGESGTGKEVVARVLHGLGGDQRPFVTVDCGSLPGSLLASELFGHEMGAFTGADRERKGAFELADGGTLFLDEVGELPLDQQAALLGAIERRRFKRTGGTSEISVDVRVVASTHRDMPRSINEGSFRLDLYYRLAVVELHLPPLRRRLVDLPELARRFAESLGAGDRFEACFPPEVLASLSRASWLGNVRELRNYVEATLVMGRPRDLPKTADEASSASPADLAHDALAGALLRMPFHDARDHLVRAHERQALEYWLAETEGNVSLAARRMGVNRTYLHVLLAKHGLSPRKNRED